MASRSDVKVTTASAVGGAVVLGGTGAAVGTTIGTVVGVAVGALAAPVTFGLSVPVGAAVGGGTGLCVGTAAGTGTGLVAGGAVGYGAPRYWTNRQVDAEESPDVDDDEASGYSSAISETTHE